MIRRILFLLLAGSLAAVASDPIPAPAEGRSATVTQPHVKAELIAQSIHVTPSKPFLIALHLHMDPDWHTYWINPGDAGIPTTIKWTLPPGFSAGPIQWPTPELHAMGPLTTYGYGGDVYLLTTITPPAATDPAPITLKAHAEWLVCQEECIPGKGDFSVTIHLDGPVDQPRRDSETFFLTACQRLPVPNTRWDVSASYQDKTPPFLALNLEQLPGQVGLLPKDLRFFPEQSNVLANDLPSQGPVSGNQEAIHATVALQQNGEKPDHLSGVVVSGTPLIGDANAVYLSSFLVTGAEPPAAIASAPAPSPSQPLNPTTISAAASVSPPTNSAPEPENRASSPPTAAPPPWFIEVLGLAFIGGLILNLMPCVLPVLSLKVFSLVRHAGDHPETAWRQGVAFTTGVVISFWILAGLLIALRAAGNHLGWGFQMQSPGFVLALIFLFFLLGLNLFGVFELGASLVGLDAKATGRLGNGLISSFLNGALATLAATPCTAPFMGSAVGFAAEQPAILSLIIFTFLALGMATPYLLLTLFPGALRFVPKPGAWMEAFKQFMGFLLLATVIFLVYVFGALVGQDQVPGLLAALLLAGVAAWIYGRWAGPNHRFAVRLAAWVLAFMCLAYAIDWGATLARATPPKNGAMTQAGNWQPWSPEAVDDALAQGRPVFVDFTAAWCLSCKVNEKVALETTDVQQAFAKKNVALFVADWTHSDPAISAVLATFHRDGVPLYLLYSPKAKDAPQVLPAVLTPGIVLKALDGT
jgi:thiol:disulfide interchange protein DsbD